jgi:hypothetical protein
MSTFFLITISSYYTRGRAEAAGKGMDWTAARPVGLEGKETSPPGLGTAVACREQEARSYRTTRDSPRGS